MRTLAIAIGAILIPGAAAAHLEPGAHGHLDLLHYLTDPSHVGLTGAAVLLALVIRRVRQRRQLVRASSR